MNKDALTCKELAALEDELAAEQQLVKKFRAYATMATDPQLKTTCEQLAQKHQHHFDTLMTYLQ